MIVEPAAVTLLALGNVPMVQPGDDLGAILIAALDGGGQVLRDGDIIVIAQKIVSKAEGRAVRLADVTPSPRAIELAAQCDKDARLVELILSETDSVMRVRRGVLVVRHRLGLVLANAGIDQSNIAQDGDGVALLLPVDPDASAAALRDRLAALSGADIAVVIIDSLGRAWRKGTCGIAIGVAGMAGLLDLRGVPDLHGRPLQTSELGLADEVAAAASLVMGQGGEGRPVVLARGIARGPASGCAADLIREPALDLFP
ncbi:coenzyme F420-0:L-glutamate ligase [Sphingobium sp. KCTC 72723]|uniref:coenzyme F420-0:L-glutamate ligase n=1 Tax=Sphingobium sp. KCTC 72723 TaxID=2733867 RepID=UPI00165DB463|nr:coenzyme F420-0:L-glutamate ligase [Sphingobium sp. KCTC 72723]